MLVFICLLQLINSLSNELDIYYFDVGQADSQLLVFPNGFSILVDLGEESSGATNAKYVGTRLEQILGTKHINILVVSHLHRDHIGSSKGGIRYLVDTMNFTFDKLIDRDHGYNYNNQECYSETIDYHNIGTMSSTGVDWICLVASEHSNHHLKQIREVGKIYSTDQINVGLSNVQIQIVQIDAYSATFKDNVTLVSGNHRYDTYPPSENDYSICLKITFNKFVYLTCGDLDGEYETSDNGYIYNDIENVTKNKVGEIDLYHVNHHGSSHSNNKEWLSTLKPSASVISCGEDNTYNHPSEEALNNLQEYSYIFATEDCNSEVTNKFSDYTIINGDILVRVPQEALNYYVSDIKQTKINKFKIKN